MGSGTGGDKTFAAKVSVEIDEASLKTAGVVIKKALEDATKGIDFKAFRDFAEAAKLLAAQTDNMAKAEAARSTAKRESVALAKAELDAAERALNAELNLAKIDRQMAEDAKVRAQGLDAMAEAQRELNALLQQQGPLEKDLQTKLEAQLAAERDGLKLVAQTIDEKKRLAAINKAEEEAAKKQAAAEKEIAALTDKQLSSQTLITQTENARVAANDRLKELMAEQKVLTDQQAATAERIKNAVPFAQGGTLGNLGTLGGALGQNFLSSFFSGGGLSSSLSQSLGQLQPALFGIAQGGEQATQAFAKLGIEGVGSVSALTQGVAAFGASFLAVLPLIGEMGNALKGAYDQQVEFVFQSGLLAKQLGTSAEEGAKLRALLKLVGQEDNIFAAITLNQIQASVAALDRYNKGLEKATPQVEKFGQALTQLGVSYKNQDGSLKTFAELVVDISAGLEKLSASQRSLAIQNLAGLFGSDVAKIFGYGPGGLVSILDGAAVASEALQKQNDALQISLTNLSNAQTNFNVALTAGFVPFQNFLALFGTNVINTFTDGLIEARAFLELPTGAENNEGGYISRRATATFAELTRQRAALAELEKDSTVLPGVLQLQRDSVAGLEAEYAKLTKTLEDLSRRQSDAPDAAVSATKSVVDQKAEISALEKALKAVDAAAKEYIDIQKDIVKSNENTSKSFFSQIDAIQKAAGAYDTFYEKVGQSSQKISDIQSTAGKAFSYIGTGTVKDVEKAIVDLRVLEERLGKAGSPGDPRYDQLALNIRRRRAALGLQPGELTEIGNVDVTVGITGLSKKQLAEINDEFAKLVELKREFLKGGFDVTQSTFNTLLSTLTDLPVEQFSDVLTGGASALQKYAESLGLFASPGFSQAIGEAALKTKLLAGGFGEINTAAGAEAAFGKYLDAFKGFREDLFNLSEFIANPQKLTVPLALDFGLITQTDVTLASQAQAANKAVKDAFLEGGTGIADAIDAQAQAALTGAAQQKLGQIQEGGGIVNLLLAKYGITPGKAIEATAEFSIDSEADFTLAKKSLDADFKRLKAEEEAKQRALTLNIEVDAIFNTDAIRERIQDMLNAIAPGGVTTNPPIQGPQPNPGWVWPPPSPDTNAAGGPVFRGMPTLVGEEGKPEFFIPRSDGRIIPGNETASLMRLMAGSERMPTQPIINYSPVVQQYLTVDARGTNARDVTAAITRTQAKQTLFTSSSALVRDRDFLRAHGIR